MEEDLLRKLQLCEFEILKYFIEICEKEKLTYYISGGTYLGAVRHKGFIPWDDDVDIAMPRSDYEKFLEVANKYTKYKLKNFKYTKDYILLPSRLVDARMKVVSRSMIKEQVWEAWIDIFPLDGLPNNFILRQLYKFNLLEKRLLLKLSCFNEVVNINKKDRNIIEKFFIFLGKHIRFEKIIDTKKRLYKLDNTLKKQSAKKSKYYMNFYGAYKFKSIMNKDEFYGEGAYYDFEGLKLFGPKYYDKYLTKIYGDYMKLPNDQEKNQHNTTLIGADE